MLHLDALVLVLPSADVGTDLLQVPVLILVFSLAALIGGILVRLGARVALGFTPPFMEAWGASFCGIIVAFLIEVVALGFNPDLSLGAMKTSSNEWTIPIQALATGWVYGAILHFPQTESGPENPDPLKKRPIGFPKGMLVVLIQTLAVLLIAGIPVGISKLMG
jgi:hypothetical protein